MTEFATTASLAVGVEQSSLQSARRTIENALGDITVDVAAQTPAADGGTASRSLGSVDTGPSLTGGTTASEPETTVPILREQLEVQEIIFQELQDINDDGGFLSGGGDGGGGIWDFILGSADDAGEIGGAAALTGAAGALSGAAASLTGAAGALTGAAGAMGLSGGGGGSVKVKNTPLPVEEIDDIEVKRPGWIPLRVKDPSPLQVEDPSPLKVKDPSPLGVKDPSPLRVKDPSPLGVDDPSPLRVKDPSPLTVKDPSPLLVADPSPLIVSDPSPLTVADPSPLQVEDVVLPVEDKVFRVAPIGGFGGVHDVTMRPPQVRGPGLGESMIEGAGKGMAVGAGAGIAAGFLGGPLAPISVPAGAVGGGLIGGAGGAIAGGLNFADRFAEAQQRNTHGTIRPRRGRGRGRGGGDTDIDTEVNYSPTYNIDIERGGIRREVLDEVRERHTRDIRELRERLDRLERSFGGRGRGIR